MYPVLLNIGWLKIRSYGVILGVAFLLTYWLTYRDGIRKGYDKKILENLLFFIIVSGILGARILYVLTNLPFYIDEPYSVIRIWEGGLVYYGGLLAGAIFGFWYLHHHRLNPWGFADLIAPYISVGYAIGRIGCLMNGCCYGLTRIPIQIYSSIISLILFLILLRMKRKREFEGEVFFWYLTLYSAARFIIEFFRADPRGHILFLSISQVLSLIGIPFATFMMVRLKDARSKESIQS